MKTKTKQITRTGTESEKWTSHGGISVGKRNKGENVQGRRSIFSRHKIDGERYKWYRKLKEHICTMHGHELIGVECWRVGGVVQRGNKKEQWENRNSIINKNTLIIKNDI